MPSWVIQTLLIANLGMAGADVSVTQRCLGERVCREANPVMGWAGAHPVAFGMVSVGTTAGMSLWIASKRKEHPRAVTAALVGLLVFKGFVVSHNARIWADGRRR